MVPGRSWAPLVDLWGSLGVLGASWEVDGRPWRVLGGGHGRFWDVPGGSLGFLSLPGRSWGALGRPWRVLGTGHFLF